MNRDAITGSLAHSLACTTHLLALHHTLCSLAPLRSFIRTLAHSRACGKVSDYMSQIDLILSHSEPGINFSLTSGASGSSVLLGVCTMVQKKPEFRCNFWASCLSVSSFTGTAYSFACSAPHALLPYSVALIHSLAGLLLSL